MDFQRRNRWLCENDDVNKQAIPSDTTPRSNSTNSNDDQEFTIAMPALVTELFLRGLRDVRLLKTCRLVSKSWNIEASDTLRARSKILLEEASRKFENFATLMAIKALGPSQHLPSPFQYVHLNSPTFTDPKFNEFVLNIPITSLSLDLDLKDVDGLCLNQRQLCEVLAANNANITNLELRARQSRVFVMEKNTAMNRIKLTSLKSLKFHDGCISLFWSIIRNIQKNMEPLPRLLKYHVTEPKIVVPEVKSTQEEQGCTIPLTPVWPQYFSKWEPQSSVYDCSYVINLAKFKDNKIFRILQGPNISCCLHEVIRGRNDSSYNLTKCTPLINDIVDVGDREVLLVKCGNHTNFHANVPIKPKVQEKINYWKGIPEEERPFNVFVLGIDTVSRSHAYRSLPKSIKLMTELGFIDFEAYHSVAPSTIPNLMAMLMGLSRAQVRGTCSKSWVTPFDDCPLIWKKFSENNYVTSYVEDGAQSFNWGGQSGFVNQPTDYYLHHLFLSLAHTRGKINKEFGRNAKKHSLECTTQERVPEFLLQYNSRLLKKFANTPYFLISWFENPFHDDIYSLANFDEYIASFIEFLKLERNVLRKSVVIFVSDHGDRTNFFESQSIESYFERGLPFFQIRLPDQMRENYPEFIKAIQSNSRKLTTPFDIHQTLLHVLTLKANLSLVSKDFEPDRKDRCSLFVDVPINRTCASTNIPWTNCLCNAQYDENATNKHIQKVNSESANHLLAFSVTNLNMKIQRSKYKPICSEWSSSPDDIMYAKYIGEGKSYREILIAFTANPGDAKFEVRLKIKKRSESFEVSKFLEVVGFSRINRFGDGSWCIPMETDEDKEMKELCLCKIQRV
ncbi:unnamed protein product [Allacma fusca]|uniref:Uncharacterized protein n=1 Tax=Allacma fusca TaxID=39272 RepID=A0A8J2L224_9HEXA|nr:unnamed protein product [Allacma fusca]